MCDLSPLTSSSTAEKTSGCEFLWTPQRYNPESFRVRLKMVTVNILEFLSSVSLNLPFSLLLEVISACCRHVKGRFPLQRYFSLSTSSESYGHLMDTEPSSTLWVLFTVLQHRSEISKNMLPGAKVSEPCSTEWIQKL